MQRVRAEGRVLDDGAPMPGMEAYCDRGRQNVRAVGEGKEGELKGLQSSGAGGSDA